MPGPGVLKVDPGRETYVTAFTVSGLPPEIHTGKLRNIKGQLMTPKLLDARADRPGCGKCL